MQLDMQEKKEHQEHLGTSGYGNLVNMYGQ